jgi:hypothetical protein
MKDMKSHFGNSGLVLLAGAILSEADGCCYISRVCLGAQVLNRMATLH